MRPFHTETSAVRFGELDADGGLSLRALCERLQDGAAAGAASLGVSMQSLAERGLAWVLHELRIRIQRPARLGEALSLTTWPREFGRLIAERDFEITVGEEVLAAATSRWAVVDLEARRAVRLDESLRALPTGDRRAQLAPPIPRRRGLEPDAGERRFEVRRSDLDSVGHVNHTRYVDWIVESVPDPVWDGCRIAGIEVSFSREVRRGQRVVSRAASLPGAENDTLFAHELLDAEERLLASATTRWRGAAREG